MDSTARRGWAPEIRFQSGTLCAFCAAAAAVTLGWGLVRFHGDALVASPSAISETVLGAIGAVALVTLRRGILRATGPGAQIAGFALALGFLLGLIVLPASGVVNQTRVDVLLATATVMFFVGAAVAALFAKHTSAQPVTPLTDPFRSSVLLFTAGGFLAAALMNLVTGSIPIVSANINAARFAGAGGVFYRLWPWIIGGVEAVLVITIARAVVARRLDSRGRVMGIVSTAILVALAARSFLLIVAIAAVVVLATLGRMSATRFAILAAIGLIALGVAGQLRAEHSQGNLTTSRAIKQSLGIGPTVVADVAREVPQVVAFQGGRFLLRDLRSALPFHPFGRPEAGDIWVTEAIRQRDPSVVGGTPPTLAGGLYIDFGVPGVILGTAFLGALLAWLYAWARRRRTIGALAAYAYVASYAALSAYSYVSFKPAALMAVAVCVQVDRVEGRHAVRIGHSA